MCCHHWHSAAKGAMRQSSAAKGRTKWEMTFTSLPSAGIMNCTLYGRLDESCLPLNVLMTCEAHSAPLPDVVNLYQHDERVLHLSIMCFTPQSGNARAHFMLPFNGLSQP